MFDKNELSPQSGAFASVRSFRLSPVGNYAILKYEQYITLNTMQSHV
jgi:hypothetical protein